MTGIRHLARACAPARGDRGSATAELAVALPAVVLVLLLGLGGLAAGVQQIALQDAVADAARLLGRGDVAAAHALIGAAGDGVQTETSEGAELVCLTAHTTATLGGHVTIPLSATGCALTGGR